MAYLAEEIATEDVIGGGYVTLDRDDRPVEYCVNYQMLTLQPVDGGFITDLDKSTQSCYFLQNNSSSGNWEVEPLEVKIIGQECLVIKHDVPFFITYKGWKSYFNELSDGSFTAELFRGKYFVYKKQDEDFFISFNIDLENSTLVFNAKDSLDYPTFIHINDSQLPIYPSDLEDGLFIAEYDNTHLIKVSYFGKNWSISIVQKPVEAVVQLPMFEF